MWAVGYWPGRGACGDPATGGGRREGNTGMDEEEEKKEIRAYADFSI
jgi:hypothetical protein